MRLELYLTIWLTLLLAAGASYLQNRALRREIAEYSERVVNLERHAAELKHDCESLK